MDHKELAERIRVVAPGTQLRFALDKIVAANTGALIFLVDDFEKYKDLMQVGFFLNCPFNPNKLYELSKMDGAIVVDESLNKIIAANVQLTPDPSIPSLQTGMRRRTAERMARQTGKMLLAISKRQGTITIFFGENSHVLAPVEILLPRVNQVIRTVEQYRQTFAYGLDQIDVLERASVLTLYDVLKTLEKGLMVLLISKEAELTLVELGKFGLPSRMQLDEITDGIPEEIENLVLDFAKEQVTIDKIEELMEKLLSLTEREISNYVTLARVLGYDISSSSQAMELNMRSRGIRFVRKIPKIPLQVALNVGAKYGSLARLLKTSVEELKEVEGVGEKRARAIRHAIDIHNKREELE
jgi:diadenylate cyclase